MKFPNMFSPVQIGTVTVPNRFVVPPMGKLIELLKQLKD